MGERGILEYVLDHAAAHPDRIFLTQPLGGNRVADYSWAQVLDQSRRMAAHLQSLVNANYPCRFVVLPRRQALGGRNIGAWLDEQPPRQGPPHPAAIGVGPERGDGYGAANEDLAHLVFTTQTNGNTFAYAYVNGVPSIYDTTSIPPVRGLKAKAE